jgi:23S rRNA A1618 N6-methylase RlmF
MKTFGCRSPGILGSRDSGIGARAFMKRLGCRVYGFKFSG